MDPKKREPARANGPARDDAPDEQDTTAAAVRKLVVAAWWGSRGAARMRDDGQPVCVSAIRDSNDAVVAFAIVVYEATLLAMITRGRVAAIAAISLANGRPLKRWSPWQQFSARDNVERFLVARGLLAPVR